MKKTLSLTLWEYCQRKKISIESMKAKGYQECLRLSSLLGCEPPSAEEFKFNLNLVKEVVQPVVENKTEELNKETDEMKKLLVEIPTRQKQNILDSRVVLTDAVEQSGNLVEGNKEQENLSEVTSAESTTQKKKKVLL